MKWLFYSAILLTGCATIKQTGDLKIDEVNHIKIAHYKAVKESNSAPTVYMFSADWCEPCKIAKPVLEAEVKKKGNIAVEVDVNDFRIWEKMPYQSLPTFIFVKDGKETVLKGWNEEKFREAYKVF